MFRHVLGFALVLTGTSFVSGEAGDVQWVRDPLSARRPGRPRFEETHYLHRLRDLPGMDSTGIWLPQGRSVTEEQLELTKGVTRDDFLVNDDTTGGCSQEYASAAMDGSGRSVVAWEDKRNVGWDIYAQRYDSAGNPQGPNFRVNDDAGTEPQQYPSVAMDGAGGFVVVWADQRNRDTDIYAQRYDPSGNPQGPNFKVNDDVISEDQDDPSVAIGESGGFVIAWQDYRNGDDDIYAQRYDSSGIPQGSNFRVNDDVGSTRQWYAAVSMDGTGGFVVTWEDGRNGDGNIYAQRYDAPGNPQGSNFRVNDDVGSASQEEPSIAMDGSGKFVVAWEDDRNGDADIYAQRYDSSGVPQGSNFRVNDDVGTEYQRYPSVAKDGTGGFVVAWGDERRNGDDDIFAQRYDSSGNPQGSNFRVNDDVGSAWQYSPSVAMAGSGGFVATWADGRNWDSDIYAQRYDASGNPLGPNFRVNDDVGSAGQGWPSAAMDVAGGFVVVWTDDRNGWDGDIYAQRYDSSGIAQGPNFRVNDDVGSASQLHTSVDMNSSGDFVVTWVDGRVADLDIYAQRYDSLGNSQGSNFRVNDVSGSAHSGFYSVAIAMDGTGMLVVTWTDDRNGWDGDIYAQRYDSSGVPQGPNFRVNDDVGTQYQRHPSVAKDETGDFVVTWYDERDEWSGDIYGQRYDASGVPQGPNFRVNDDVGSADQEYPSVTMDPAGGRFVIFWTDYRNGDGDPEVVAQKHVDGVPLGPNLQINQPDSLPYNHQQSWRFSVASTSDLVIFAWMDNRRHKSWDIYAKLTDWDLVGIEEHSPEYLYTTYSFVSHPNPFINRTTLKFSLTETCMANLQIYDAAGREVAGLLRKRLEPGNHRIVWTPSERPSGVYFAKLKLGDFTQTRKLVVLR